MEHPEDLYLLDAEQAVRELAVYLDGTSNYQSHRIVATTNYLATLLRTLGMDRLGLAGERLVEALEQLDEGQGRRLIREFTESTEGALDAVRKGSTQPEGSERLDRLLERLTPFTPQSEAMPHFDWGPRETERDLLSHAFKAIQAADSFAAILSREARPGGASGGHFPFAEASEASAERGNPWQGSGHVHPVDSTEQGGPQPPITSHGSQVFQTSQSDGPRAEEVSPHEPLTQDPRLDERRAPDPWRHDPPLKRQPLMPDGSPEPANPPDPPDPLDPPDSHDPLDSDPLEQGGDSTHPEQTEPGEQLEQGEHFEPGERRERFVRVVSPEFRALRSVPAEAGRSKSAAPGRESPNQVTPEAPRALMAPESSIAPRRAELPEALPTESTPHEAARSEVAAPAPPAKANRRRRGTNSATTPATNSATTPATTPATTSATNSATTSATNPATTSATNPAITAAAHSAKTPAVTSAVLARSSASSAGPLSTPGQIALAHHQSTSGNREMPEDQAASAQPTAATPGELYGTVRAPQALTPGTLAVDAAFRSALRLADESAWARGLASLLESIDTLDHQPLAVAFPTQLTLLRGSELQCHSELVGALASALATLPCSGVAEASLAGTTLALVVELERAIAATPLARLVAHFHGRIEVDPGRQRWKILVPSSARLLRVVPLRLEEHWIAVSWAQFLGLDIATQREAQLRIGEEPDRLRVVEAGPAVVGVRFDLDPALRRRERYRGLVLTPASQWLPTYA